MRLFRSIMIAALTLPTVGAAPAAPADKGGNDDILVEGRDILNRKALTFDLDAPYVTVSVKGQQLKLRVEFDWAEVGITVNPDVARRLRLEPTAVKSTPDRCMDDKLDIQLDSGIHVMGALPRLGTEYGYLVDFGTAREKRVFWWSDRQVAADADGVIGPEWLPQDRVTLRLHDPLPGEQAIEIRLTRIDGAIYRFFDHQAKINGKWMTLRYAPQERFNIATSAAGAHLAEARGGHWSGEPTPIKLDWGMQRPGRHITLDRGLSLGGLPLRGFMVDTTPLKGVELPREAPTADPDGKPDPEAIIVEGRRFLRPKNCGAMALVLGQEALRGCSSITHDKKRKILTFQCLETS